MTTATLTQSSKTAFTKLMNVASIGTVLDNLDAIFKDIGNIDADTITDFSSLSLTGIYGTYTGKGVNKSVEEDNSTQLKILDASWSNFQANIKQNAVVPKGTYNMLGTLAGKYDIEAGKGSLTYTGTGFTFDSGTGITWSLKGSSKVGILIDQDAGTQTGSYMDTYTSFTFSDSAGSSIQYSGSIKYDETIDSHTGTINAIKAVVEGVTYSASNLKVPVKDLGHVTAGMALEWILSGNDTLTIDSTSQGAVEGFAGSDKITGSINDDEIYGGSKWETKNSGKDIIDGGAGNDKIDGGDGADTLSGNTGDDYIDGQKGNDKIFGGDGNDILSGDDGNDVIDGGAGNDFIMGGSGKDSLNGGAGKDEFRFGMEDLIGRFADTINDFKQGEDHLYIDDTDWNHVIITAKNFYAASGAKWAISSDQKYIYDTSTGVFYYDADANGSGKGIAICTIVGKPTLTVADFS